MNASSTERRSDASNRIRRREPSAETWPVLATIPRIVDTGTNGAAENALWEAELPDALQSPPSQQQLASDYNVADDEMMAEPETEPTRRGVFVDQKHIERGQRADELAGVQTTAQQGSDARSNDNNVDGTLRQRQTSTAAPSDVAARLYRLHAAVAPYSGVIVAIALVLSAGLLYWLMLSPPQETLSYEELFGRDEELGEYGEDSIAGVGAFGDYTLSRSDNVGDTAGVGVAANGHAGRAVPVYSQFDGVASAPSETVEANTALPAPSLNLPQAASVVGDSPTSSPMHVARPDELNDRAVERSNPTPTLPNFESTASPAFDVAKAFPDAILEEPGRQDHATDEAFSAELPQPDSTLGTSTR